MKRYKVWKLSPSDFAFLWDECKRCFYLKVVSRFPRPSMPFPRIFNVIDGAMKDRFTGRHTRDILPELPAGTMEFGDKWVKSIPIGIQGKSSSCYIQGKIDSVIKCNDGSYAVIDFKTSSVHRDHVKKYARQLHAYAYSLGHAAPGSLGLKPVSSLGLIVYDPSKFEDDKGGSASLQGTLTWLEVPLSEKRFLEFIGQVLDVLSHPSPPQASPGCNWCRYRSESRTTGL